VSQAAVCADRGAYLQYSFETLPTVTTAEGIEALLPHWLPPETLKILTPVL
jgi:hypothetical protein